MQTIWANEVIGYNGSAPTHDVITSEIGNTYTWQTPSANGDWLEWGFYMPAGTYTLLCLGFTNSSYGKTDCYIDGNLQFSGMDWYSASLTANVVLGGSVTIATTGYHVLRLTINGKNGSSSNYNISYTKFWFRV